VFALQVFADGKDPLYFGARKIRESEEVPHLG
jgi:hypothetical protein